MMLKIGCELKLGICHEFQLYFVKIESDLPTLPLPPSDGKLYGVRDGIFVVLMAGSVSQA